MIGAARRDAGAPFTWLAIFVVASTAGFVLSAAVASGRPILASRWSLLWQLAVWAVAWMVAVVAAFHLPRRTAVVATLVAGTALRLAALAGPPTTSDDLYRYSWDGRVQVAGIDPYRDAPASATLAGLREPWLWPDAAGCAAIHRPAGCTRINRPGERTIYPPVAEAWFAAVYRIAGVGSRYKAWQVAGLLTELGVLALLPVTLRRWGRDPRWVALYALCPVPVLEVVNNGHVDGLAVLFLLAALAVVARSSAASSRRQDGGPGAEPVSGPPAGVGPSRHREPTARMAGGEPTVLLAGVLIGAAALVKLYPAVLVLALVGMGTRRWVPVVRAGATAAAVVALAYAEHVARVGLHVLGYLPGYLSEEHYSTGGRFLLASLGRVPAGSAAAVSATFVGAACAWVWWRRPAAPAGAALLLGAVLLAASPVQPWYAVSLVAVATVAGRPWWAGVALAGYPYFFAVILADRHAAGIGEIAYAAALAAAVVGAGIAARRPLPSDQCVTSGATSSTRLS